MESESPKFGLLQKILFIDKFLATWPGHPEKNLKKKSINFFWMVCLDGLFGNMYVCVGTCITWDLFFEDSTIFQQKGGGRWPSS